MLGKFFSKFLDKLCDIAVFLSQVLFKNIYAFDPQYIRELTRYFVVGVLVSLGYTITVLIIVEKLQVATPVVASIISFFLWAPASYVGHKEFTFEYSGELGMSAVKFFVVFGAKLIASVLAIIIVQSLGYSYIFGVLANWFVIPVATFIVLKLWVFDEA